LPLALLTNQFPALACGVLPFPPFAFQGDLDAPAAKSPSGRTRAAGKEPATQRRNHRRDIRVKTVEESSSISGYDAYKHVKGRKRHILVDTLGIPLSIYVTEADVHDTKGARCLLAGLAPLVPRIKKIWADAAYWGRAKGPNQ